MRQKTTSHASAKDAEPRISGGQSNKSSPLHPYVEYDERLYVDYAYLKSPPVGPSSSGAGTNKKQGAEALVGAANGSSYVVAKEGSLPPRTFEWGFPSSWDAKNGVESGGGDAKKDDAISYGSSSPVSFLYKGLREVRPLVEWRAYGVGGSG